MRPGAAALVGSLLALGGCGPRGAIGEGSGGGSSSTAAADTTTVAASSESGGGSTGSPNDTGGGCVPAFEIGELVPITDSWLGRLQIYDFDVDGVADIVGTYGTIAFQRDDGFDLVPSPEPIEPSWCRAGRFDGDDVPDLVFRISAHRLRLHVGGAADPVVDTLVEDVTGLEPRDMDGDGIDDLVIGIANGERVESWRGTASGVFESTFSTSWPGLANGIFAALEPPRVDLAITDTAALHVYVGDGAGGFAAADSLELWSTGLVQSVRLGDRDGLVTSWGWSQLRTNSGVGLVLRDDRGSLAPRVWDQSPRWPVTPPTAGDLDDDGAIELLVAMDDADGIVLEVGCPVGEQFVRCGTRTLDHAPQWLALLPGPVVRVVYTTTDEGTWIAPIAANGCR
jgi:hypothetical protein